MMSASRFPDDTFPTYLLIDKNDAPWDTSILQNAWNGLIKEYDLPFRSFHVGGKSTAASIAKWFYIHLMKNAYLFNHHEKHPDVEDVYRDWLWFLNHACRRISEMGLPTATEKLQRPHNAKITIWRFIDPPDALLWLCGRGDGSGLSLTQI